MVRACTVCVVSARRPSCLSCVVGVSWNPNLRSVKRNSACARIFLGSVCIGYLTCWQRRLLVWESKYYATPFAANNTNTDRPHTLFLLPLECVIESDLRRGRAFSLPSLGIVRCTMADKQSTIGAFFKPIVTVTGGEESLASCTTRTKSCREESGSPAPDIQQPKKKKRISGIDPKWFSTYAWLIATSDKKG